MDLLRPLTDMRDSWLGARKTSDAGAMVVLKNLVEARRAALASPGDSSATNTLETAWREAERIVISESKT